MEGPIPIQPPLVMEQTWIEVKYKPRVILAPLQKRTIHPPMTYQQQLITAYQLLLLAADRPANAHTSAPALSIPLE